jgi:hypothetical protein
VRSLLHKALTASQTVTVPLQPVLPTFHVPPSHHGPVRFPLSWLLSHAGPAIQYRALTEVARLPGIATPRIAALPLAQLTALRLAISQRHDGTWGPSMLGVPQPATRSLTELGMINGARRLLEYGWDRESPPFVRARRVLFRLLAEDDDPTYLFELREQSAGNEDLARHSRMLLREAAGATLAQAGYENDPRVRGAARRVLERVYNYLRSPLAQKPWVRVGNKQVLAAEAAPPSIYALTMLAHMPLFRSENHGVMDRIYHYISQPLPRQEAVQLRGEAMVPQPHLVLGDALPHRNAADADVPFALVWLELMARLNFLRRNENWSKLFDRFLDDCGRDGVWHPHKGTEVPTSSSPFAWASFPLEEGSSEEARWTDVTFRLGLIARLGGRTIDVV